MLRPHFPCIWIVPARCDVRMDVVRRDWSRVGITSPGPICAASASTVSRLCRCYLSLLVAAERAALVDFYMATNGASWTSQTGMQLQDYRDVGTRNTIGLRRLPFWSHNSIFLSRACRAMASYLGVLLLGSPTVAPTAIASSSGPR